MENKENGPRNSIAFLHEQVAVLKTHYGQECDAKTVLQLLRLCPALRMSVKLLLQELSPSPLLAAKAHSLLEQLTDCTRDLHREGGIEVRDNNEVWEGLVSAVEGVVSTVLQCMDAWLQKRQCELHNRLNDVKLSLRSIKKDVQTKSVNKNEVYKLVMEVVEKISLALKGMRQWESFIPDQHTKVLDVWLKQLCTVTQLLPRVAVLTISLHQKHVDHSKNPSFCISLNVVASRLEDIIDEIVTLTSLKFDDIFSKKDTSVGDAAPGAFLTAVDKVLDLLTSSARELELQGHDARSISEEQNYPSVITKSISDPSNSFIAKRSSSSAFSDQTKITEKTELNQSGRQRNSTEKLGNCNDASYECETITATDQGSVITPNNGVVSPLGQLVKVPLEEILRHAISIAYCGSPSDNTAIMSLCEEVLAHLKTLVNIECSVSGSSCDVVEHAVACEQLAESVERLEQRANTALIRCYVRTFADVTRPLDKLLRAFQEATVSSNARQQSQVSTLPDLQELIADLDEHVDAIFQLTSLAAASSTDQSRCSSVRSSLLTLEWLESVLVPVFLQPSDRSPTAVSPFSLEKHAQLFADHWRDAAAALRQCLDASLDPAAFVMVTQKEMHASWWELKQKLYCQDVEAVQEPVERVLSMADRLSHLHESEAFMSREQLEQVSKASDELQRSLKAVSSAPENLRMRRSVLKRTQLILTVITRLSSSLHSTTLRDTTALRCAMRPNILGWPSLTLRPVEQTVTRDGGNWVATSNIGDIPLDVATPFKDIPRPSLRCKIPREINQSLSEEDDAATSSARHSCEPISDRKMSHQSRSEKFCLNAEKSLGSAITDVLDPQTNEMHRNLSGINSTGGSKSPVTVLEPSKNVRISSSILSNHSVVEQTDDQIRDMSAIVHSDRVSTGLNLTASNTNVAPSLAAETNFDNLKSIECTFGEACDDTTLDITRVLASNAIDPSIRSSIRASVRSRLLKTLRAKHPSPLIKELNVDLSNIISPAAVTADPKRPPKHTISHGGATTQDGACETSLSRPAGDTKFRNETEACFPAGPEDSSAQKSLSDVRHENNFLLQEITGLMENLSIFANNFSTSCTTVRPLQSSDVSGKNKSVTSEEGNFERSADASHKLSGCESFKRIDCCTNDEQQTGKIDPHFHDVEVLRGIKIHGASFSPQFPCIASSNNTSSSSAVLENKENINLDPVSLSKKSSGTVKTNVSCTSKTSSMTDRSLSHTHMMASIIHETEKIFSDQNAVPDFCESTLDSDRISSLSDKRIAAEAVSTQRSPLRDLNASSPPNSHNKKQVKFSFNADLMNASDVTNARNDFEVSNNYKTVSFKSSAASIATPESVDVHTPQRLLDLQTLRSKLCRLKSMLRL